MTKKPPFKVEGEWILGTPTEYYPEPNCICSVCNFGSDYPSKYCPNCGAKMKAFKCCGTCKYYLNDLLDEPCYKCNKQLNKWELL